MELRRMTYLDKSFLQASWNTLLVILFSSTLIIWGCSSSGESEKKEEGAQPNAAQVIQKEMSRLTKVNDSLRAQNEKLQIDNRAQVAHAVELETRLNDLDEKLKSQMSATPTLNVTFPPAPKITDVDASYKDALKNFRSRQYDEARSMLQSILDSGEGALEDHCYYWIGECDYALKDYQNAIDHLQKVFTYTKSSKKDDAQIMIANCYYAMGNKSKAMDEYQKLIDKYPASPYAKRAKERLSKLKE